MKKTLMDARGEALPYQLDVDDTYEVLDEVLLAGKTVYDLTNSQLVYLYRTAGSQFEFQILAGEMGRRLAPLPRKGEVNAD